MKKSLFLVALALIVASSLLAGTMAQYVKTTDAGVVNPQFKEFNFAAAKADGTTLSLKMAPGETKSWTFMLSNTENNIVSETGMLVSLNLVGANLPSGMALYVNGLPYAQNAVVAAFNSGAAAYTPVVLKAVWNTAGDSNDTSFEGYKLATVAVTFTAKQTADFQDLANFSVYKDGTNSNRIAVAFTLPAAIDLSPSTSSNISIEYYRVVDGKKVYVMTKSGNPLIKNKTWGGYLNNMVTGDKYCQGSDSPSSSNTIPAGVLLGTVVDPNYATMDYVDGNWVTSDPGALYVSVTVNIAGVIYQQTGSFN